MKTSTNLNGSVRRWRSYLSSTDSGVQWLGQIPCHWQVRPLGRCVSISGGSTPSKEKPAFWNGDVPWVSPKDMKRLLIDDSEDHITQDALGETRITLIPPPAILIVVRGMILIRDFPVGVNTIPVTINQDMKALRPAPCFFSLYLAHQLNAIRQAFFAIREESAHGTQCLRTEMWKNVAVAIPPVAEQQQIVAFLDRKTAKIDALIAKKERLIELLLEKRTALISHAVTKGLDPSVPMKDSGVAWLGEIPAHWDIIQSRRVFKVRNVPALDSDEQLTASQKYGMLPQTEFMELEGRRVVVTIKGVESLRHVEPNDFVISLRSFQGGIEWCKLRGSVTFHYVVLKPVKTIHPAYFGRLFKSSVFIQALRATTDFIRDGQDLRYSHFILVPLPLVPMDEQAAIAEFLDKETAKLDSLINVAQKTIDLLREYRTALISAAVTGKIDVREEVA